MAEAFSGRCACGTIRFVSSAEPLVALNCHCRDCQKASGAPFIAAIAVPSAAVTITGQPTYYSVEAESGNTMSRGFCPECGSRLFVFNSRRPDAMAIHLASLDDPSRYRPTADIWTSSAQKWDHMDPSLQKLPKGFTLPH
jgi:hypothetical protein